MTNPESNASAGDLLRQLRTDRGLTQEELAELVPGGLSVDTISNIERGRVRPRRHTLLALCDALDVGTAERERLLRAWRTQAGQPSASGPAARPALPAPVTPLIGREEELRSLHALLSSEGVRIVTLTGPGGVGKTRLAIDAANAVSGAFAHGCAFIDLSPLREPEHLLGLVTFSLGLADFGDRPMQERLIAHLRDKEQLLVLDNAETAVEASPQLTPILEACPGVKLLVTSREVLRLRAEHEFPVTPLALPAAADEHSPAELAGVPSVELFVQRARMVSPAFALTSENAAAVARVCARLDGLPLALELAAARLRHLSPDALAARLDHALSVLVGGPRDLPERQRTLRAAIDWSHAQLTESEQLLLRRLAVFVDGFSEAAATEVCRDGESADGDDVQAGLEGLLDKNLLTAVRGRDRGEPRFAMLETIHEYAAERLRESGEEAAIRGRHARFFAGLAEASFPEMYSERRQAWMETLRTEYGNLLAAMQWSLDGGGEWEAGLRLAGSMGRFWYFSGHLNDGRRWLTKALDAGMRSEPSVALARAFYSAGKLAWVQGDFANAVPLAHQGVSTASAAAAELFMAECLTLVGYTLVSAGNYQDALPAFEESLRIERKYDARWQIAFTEAMYSEALRLAGDLKRAGEYLEEARNIFRDLDDPWGRGVSLGMSAGVYSDSGDLEAAEEIMSRAEAAFREIDEEKYALARIRLMRGFIGLRMGKLGTAAEHFLFGLKFAQELGQTAYILVAVTGGASVAALNGHAREAAKLYAFASPLLESGAMHVDDGGVAARAAYAQCLPLVRGQLGDQDFEAAMAEGHSLSMDEASELMNTLLEESVAPMG